MKTKLTHPLQMEHDSAVLQLAHAIRLNISSKVNYDHVETAVPKTEIPLADGKHLFDLSWETTTGNIILIEVKVLKGCKKNGTSTP